MPVVSDAEEAPVALLEGSKLSVGHLEIDLLLERCLFLGDDEGRSGARCCDFEYHILDIVCGCAKVGKCLWVVMSPAFRDFVDCSRS